MATTNQINRSKSFKSSIEVMRNYQIAGYLSTKLKNNEGFTKQFHNETSVDFSKDYQDLMVSKEYLKYNKETLTPLINRPGFLFLILKDY